MTSRPVQFLLILFVCLGSLARGDAPPRTVGELWSDFDPRLDDLDVHIVREWQSDGIVYRYVTFHVGTFLDRPARIAAFYGFPVGAQQLPGLLHLHGGGQRAFLDEVDFYARR
ncbi:MAG: hypothetical protein KDA75_09970, partial [Planctomycetaceae bacterium]|nr:hypothetical protein [Planctomycetaceae bacterium]